MEAGAPLPRHWLLRALEIETDRQSGASQLSLEAVRAFRQAVEEAWPAGEEPEGVRERLLAYSGRLRRAQPGMAAIANRLAQCEAALAQGREAVLAEVDAILAGADTARQRLLEAGGSVFRPGVRVLTHGNSEAARALLTHFADRLENVTVCESRPLNEGVQLAAALAELALPVRLIPDAALELFLPECDLALVGADRVLPDGGVVNKVGTAVIARLCAAHGIPLYVAADRSKWVAEGDAMARFSPERRSPAEVLPQPPQGVLVVNVPFDLTLAALVTAYITDEGVVPGRR